MNIVIPMAGIGSRFQQANYMLPKPLIDVRGKPIIQHVVEHLNIDASYIYVIQKSHRIKYNIDRVLTNITSRCTIIEIDQITEGSACTVLVANLFINNSEPLIISDCDSFVEWDSNDFIYQMKEQNLDGGLVTFTSTDPKWSFAKVNEDGYVIQIAEKNPISNNAASGIFYWSKGSDYVKYAKQMIQKNIRVNNEFYVCPIFNEAIKDGKRIKIYPISNMWGLGTPEDLEYFLKNYKTKTELSHHR